MMYKGEPVKGIEFYNLLFESEEFTSELGKVAMASGKFEAELILLLKRNKVSNNCKNAPLGKLINIGEKNNLFDKNLTIILKDISKQRNYLTHNIYALFIDLIDETVLEKSNLLDSDVITYLEKAWQLKENLNDIANIIQRENQSPPHTSHHQ